MYGQLHTIATLSPGKQPLAPNIQEVRSASGPILMLQRGENLLPEPVTELQFLRHLACSLANILIEVFQLHKKVGQLKLLLYDYSDY